MFFFLKLKIREKHSDCNLTNLTYSYHFRSKSETTTDLFSFAKVRQNFEDTKFILLKIVKILKFLQGLLSTTSENSSFVRYQNGFLPSSYCIFIKSLGCNAK